MTRKDEQLAEEHDLDLDEGLAKPRLADPDPETYPERPVEEATVSQKEAEKVGGGAIPRAYQDDNPDKVIPADSYEAKRQERGRRQENRQNKPGASGPGVRKEG